MASDQCSETTTTTTKRVGKQNERPAPEILEQQQQQQLPCPRCDSTNTKFCYYNNYNFSQPRHFCKSCRRYWTHGGALRDIPVGGGSRKSAKRCRTSSSSSTTFVSSCSSSTTTNSTTTTTNITPATVFVGPTQISCTSGGGSVVGGGGGFTSLLSQGPGFLALAGGFGLGLGPGPGFEEMGACFGLGRGGLNWAFPGVVEDGNNNTSVGVMVSSGGPGNGVGPNMGSIGNMWQLESGENGFVTSGGGDCFAWPDLAISTPGNGLK